MLIPVPPQIGYPALAALILGESAGLPLPGETALITAGGLTLGAVLLLVGWLRHRLSMAPAPGHA